MGKPARVEKKRDRVVIKAGHKHAGKKGTVLQTQEFYDSRKLFYLVQFDDGLFYWFAEADLDVKQGGLRPYQPAKAVKCKIKKGDYEAVYRLDEFGVTSFEDEGFTVEVVE